MWTDAVLVLVAYLLGSVPHLALLAGLRHVKLSGDFHENLWKRGGKTLTVLGVVGEFAKGAIPVLVGRWLGFNTATVACAGVAAVCGQMWPVFARFDGEKGNSIGIAMVTALAFRPALAGIGIIIISLIIRTAPRLKAKTAAGDIPIVGGTYSRILPAGMAICFFSLPLFSQLFGEPVETIWATAILFILIIIRRLTAGLFSDLKTGEKVGKILANRFLYDRATAVWRQ